MKNAATLSKMSEKITDEELERVARDTTERDKSRPLAATARYDATSGRLELELKSGVVTLIPAGLIQGLANASTEQLAGVQLSASGNALNWPALDVQMSVAGLVMGLFGTREWMRQLAATEMARTGGQSRSHAKVAAARTNGSKGGRPRKQPAA